MNGRGTSYYFSPGGVGGCRRIFGVLHGHERRGERDRRMKRGTIEN